MRVPVRRRPQPDEAHLRSTWRQAAVPRIEKALAAAQERPTGGWFVVGTSGDVRVPKDGRSPFRNSSPTPNNSRFSSTSRQTRR